MQFSEVVLKRRSVRAFTTAPVERGKLETILETARLAPSARDLQAYQIVVIDESEVKTALAAAALGQHFLVAAPVVLVFCASPERSESKYGGGALPVLHSGRHYCRLLRAACGNCARSRLVLGRLLR
jgi:nitroreductase